VACHQEDDAHKAVLGDKCSNCHNPEGWKGGRFDHDFNTRFPLKDKHRTVKCESCHKDPGLREKPPLNCVACHERDDRERGHKGRYGGRCQDCHVEQGWRSVIFDHERDTKFPRAGRHRVVRCDACHSDGPFRSRAESRCYACHKAEDIHFGSFEQQCDRCHLPDDWRKIVREATDKYCGGRDKPASGQSADDKLKADFWIPACVGATESSRRPSRRNDTTTIDKGSRR